MVPDSSTRNNEITHNRNLDSHGNMVLRTDEDSLESTFDENSPKKAAPLTKLELEKQRQERILSKEQKRLDKKYKKMDNEMKKG